MSSLRDSENRSMSSEVPNSFSMLTPKFDYQAKSTNQVKIPTNAAFLEQINASSLPVSSNRYNKYFQVVEGLAPNEMLQRFSRTAPRNVQEAVKSTIMSILGNLPNYALDAALLTTNTKLANLIFQMQITGYMFKNAEYRMSLTRSLKGLPRLPSAATVTSGNVTIVPSDGSVTVSGLVTAVDSLGNPMQVEAADILKALTDEVNSLRTELAVLREQRESELRTNLLTYIQALNEKDLTQLTSDISPEVLESIELLVAAVMQRIGAGPVGPDAAETLIQQPVGALAQLCMWQMVTGYKLRELEALDKGVNMD